VGRAERQRLRGRLRPELRHVGLAERDQAGGAKAGAEGRVGWRAVVDVAQRPVAAVVRLPVLLRAEILQQKRHAAKRSVGQRRRARRIARLVEQRRDHRVQRRVVSLDAVDRRVDQLQRRHLAAPHQRRLRHRIQSGQFVLHHASVDHRRA
jgi:hypothetical protein